MMIMMMMMMIMMMIDYDYDDDDDEDDDTEMMINYLPSHIILNLTSLQKTAGMGLNNKYCIDSAKVYIKAVI